MLENFGDDHSIKFGLLTRVIFHVVIVTLCFVNGTELS
jgi:hypothetical protein